MTAYNWLVTRPKLSSFHLESMESIWSFLKGLCYNYVAWPHPTGVEGGKSLDLAASSDANMSVWRRWEACAQHVSHMALFNTMHVMLVDRVLRRSSRPLLDDHATSMASCSISRILQPSKAPFCGHPLVVPVTVWLRFAARRYGRRQDSRSAPARLRSSMLVERRKEALCSHLHICKEDHRT